MADGQQQILDPLVRLDKVVEIQNAPSLRVHFPVKADHFPVPQHIVGDNNAPHPHLVEHQTVIVGIFPLVSINEHQIESLVQTGDYLQSVAHVQHDTLFKPGATDIIQSEIYEEGELSYEY